MISRISSDKETDTSDSVSQRYSLHEFSRFLVYEPTLDQFKLKALQDIPDYYTNHPTDYMLDLPDLIRRKMQIHTNFLSHYQKFRPDSSVFRVMGTSESTAAFSITNLLCYPAIEYLGSDEQFQYYSKLIEDGRIVGAYAQTEIGHGSDVQKLDTQAVFDPVKKCFVFNSPSLRSTKYWPGGLGIFATHIITQAQLIVHGKSAGLQTFVLPIRDPKTLKSLKGVTAGDLGPKLGFKSIDNGYLILDNLEAPLDSILSRYIQIDSEGNITKSKDKNADKIAYGAMMTLRANLLRYFSELVYRNRQMGNLHKSKDLKNAFEIRKELDHLSLYHSFILCSNYTRKILQRFMNHYKNNNQEKALKSIGEIHFLTTGFKALSSWECVKSAREEAVSIGLGNLMLSGLMHAYSDAIPTATYEGDNVVLMLQVIRSILGTFTSLMGGNEIKGSLKFLNKYKSYAVEQQEFDEVINIQSVEDLFQKSDEILENFVFKSIQIIGKKIQDAMMNEELPMKRIMSEGLQTELVGTAVKIFQIVNHKLAAEVYNSEITEKHLQATDKIILGKLVQLHKLVYLQEKLNSLLGIGILSYNQNVENIIQSAKETIYKDLVPETDYLFSQGISKQNEISTTVDYSKLDHKSYLKSAETIKNVCKDIQANFHKLSKL